MFDFDDFKTGLIAFGVSGLLGVMIMCLIFGATYGDGVKLMNGKTISTQNGKDIYICERDEESNTRTIHKGNSTYMYGEDSKYNSISFNCEKGIDSHSHFSTSEEKPDNSEYDKECEECFAGNE